MLMVCKFNCLTQYTYVLEVVLFRVYILEQLKQVDVLPFKNQALWINQC